MSRTEKKIDFFVRTSLPPVEGIFFEGQIYDAYELPSRLDRFLMIDDDVYHIGASIKDLGKRRFAIMRMQETKAEEILKRLQAS